MPKVDAKGRVVLPQAIRERLDIAPGTEVRVREEDGEVVIRPEDDPDRIVERLERLVEETSSRRGATEPLDGGGDPVARRHREAVQRGTEGDSVERSDSVERDGTDE